MRAVLKRLIGGLPQPLAVALRRAACAARSISGPAADEASQHRLLWLATSGYVVSGPFAGTRTIGTSAGSSYSPKILGTYELELHPLWTVGWLGRFRSLVNLGCGEGFYLAAIAHLLRSHRQPLPSLSGYDLDRSALAEARRLLAANGFESATLAATGWEDALAAGPGPVLLFCDIEGAEAIVLDPAVVPGLASVAIVCEVHDDPGSDATKRLLLRRFQASHHIREFAAQPRTPADFPRVSLCRFDDAGKLALMDEHRKRGNNWVLLEPRDFVGTPP
jgi:hypothetical protein